MTDTPSSQSHHNKELAAILAIIDAPEDVEYIKNRVPIELTLDTENQALWNHYAQWVERNNSVDLPTYTAHFKAGILSTYSSAKRSILLRLWNDAVDTSKLLHESKDEVVRYHGNYKAALALLATLTPLLESASYDSMGTELEVAIHTALEEVERYSVTEANTKKVVTSDIRELLAERQENGVTLDWSLEQLNLSVGPARSGMLYLITAPVETGKTLAVSDLSRFFASQVPPDRPVLWFNNEESAEQILFRSYMSTLGMTRPQIETDLDKAAEEYQRRTNGALQLIDDAAMSIFEVEQIVRERKPSAIFLDVADKFSGYESESRDDLRLLKLYGKMRYIAKQYDCVVVAISQADSTALEHQYFHYSQMSGSKVSKPGEADVIITINKDKDPDPGSELTRYLWVCKNKTAGGGRFAEQHRHGKWIVDITPTIARFTPDGTLPHTGELTDDAKHYIREWRTRLLAKETEQDDKDDESKTSPDLLRRRQDTSTGQRDLSEGRRTVSEGEARPLLPEQQDSESRDGEGS